MGFPNPAEGSVGRLDFIDLNNLMKFNPFVNLLANGSFDLERGVSGEVAYWFHTGAEVIDHQGGQKIYGNAAARFEPSTSNTMFQEVVNYEILWGQTISFGAWVRTGSTVTDTKIQISDGVGSSISGAVGVVNVWTWLEVTHTVDASATKVSCEMVRNAAPGSSQAFMDGAVCCLGTGVPRSGFVPIDFGVLARRQGLYSAAPSWTPEKGDQYFNTSDNKSYIWNGSTWNALY